MFIHLDLLKSQDLLSTGSMPDVDAIVELLRSFGSLKFIRKQVLGGFHSHGDTPIAGWFIRENPNLKWMMTRGTLNYGNSHLTSNNRDSTGQDGPSGNFSENAMGDGL